MKRIAGAFLLAIALIHLGGRTNQAQPATNTRTGSISGVVISTSGSLPIDTTVYVNAVGSAEQPRTSAIKPDGTFKMDHLEIGVYRVWAAAPGFVVDAPQITVESRGVYHTGDSAHLTLRKGGVITGKVLNSSNAPVVATPVRAVRIADERGKPVNVANAMNERLTDDRGVYRIYGLPPGLYIVSAGGAPRFGGFVATPYDQDVPTFAPSSTRHTATSVVVQSGDETTLDIQYRGDHGHAISGNVSGLPTTEGSTVFAASVSLVEVKTRTIVSSATATASANQSFAFYGLADGEYELVAQMFTPARDIHESAPKRIKVRQADIAGVNLVVAPLASISGRVILDSSVQAECIKRRETAFQETLVAARRQKQTSEGQGHLSAEPIPLTAVEQYADVVPDPKGDFVLRNLRAGTFHLALKLPSDAWYLRSAALGPQTKSTDAKVFAEGISVRQSVSGLTMTLAEGAAAISGQLTVAENQRLPLQTFVYLVPAEKENAANPLRYFEARAASDGKFALKNVPPGEYLIVGLGADAERPPGILVRQDAAVRATVIDEAKKSKQSVVLKPCERIDNFEFPFSAASRP